MKGSSVFPPNPVLIVDDEAESLRSFSMALRMQGIGNLVQCNDSRNVTALLSERPFDLMLLDLTMPFVAGEEILSIVSEQYPETPVIVVTAMDEVDTAVRCMKTGAFDYMIKPVERNRLVSGVRRAIEIKELRDQSRLLSKRMLSGGLINREAFSGIVTASKKMLSIFQYMESIVASRQPVLVTGETGVGKELIARAFHTLSASKGPLISVNVAGLDDNVFSDTLFGHLKGAFTGAAERRMGLVEKAAGGILHLDEIGDLNHESQTKLLRLLQEGEYFPLGSDTAKNADIRVVATTNRDLFSFQESGNFRRDLYYRLSVHHIHIPPLRERPEDVPVLLKHFIDESARSLAVDPPEMPENLPAMLSGYKFPGNIRELKTMVHDVVSSNRTGRLSLKKFSSRFDGNTHILEASPSLMPSSGRWLPTDADEPLPTMDEAEILLIREALRRSSNNQSRAARLLGISRQRLARSLKAAI